jgi:hypothetical protein
MHMTSETPPGGARTGWKGAEIDYRERGLHVFSEVELAEMERALRHLLALSHRDFTDVTPASFPLERLGDYMRGLCDTLRNGPGFTLLRGIPRDRYSADEMAWIYVGLGSYLGSPTVQSHAGDVLGHVIDVHEIEPESRGYRKGGGQLMHVDSTDMCDIVGLMCLRAARAGGASRIASATAVYRDIERRRPDLAAALREGYYYRRTAADGKHATRMQSPHRIAAFAETGGELSCYFVTAYIRRAAEHDSPLTPGSAGGVEGGGAAGRIAGVLSRHGVRRGRHPVSQQPRDTPRAHGLPGPRRLDPAPPPHAAVAARTRMATPARVAALQHRRGSADVEGEPHGAEGPAFDALRRNPPEERDRRRRVSVTFGTSDPRMGAGHARGRRIPILSTGVG